MKYYSKIILFLTLLLLISCIKPVKIIIPEKMQNIPAMPVVGTENSWRLDFGGFHTYNIFDSDSRVLLTDARNASYDIRSFEFMISTAGGTQFECYCEFPMKALDDETFMCTFQNVYNQFDLGKLTDRVISASSGEIAIETYYEFEGNKPGSKKVLVGYLFMDSGINVGLVDVSNTNNETVWIDPSLDLHKQIMVAASSTSLILKHRKWYKSFYNNLDQETPQDGF